MKLTDIIGHAEAKRTLLSAIARDRIHHAYLFTGPDGVGKRRVAYGFVARLFCESLDSQGDACGACRHCKRVFATVDWFDARMPFAAKDDAPELAPCHPDVVTLVAHGQAIKIDQVRAAMRLVHFQPVEASVRVIIIEEAHLMNDEAANALLKTLEEPPSRTRFILLSSQPSSLLVTIRSRCQRVSFGRLSDEDLKVVLRARLSEPLSETQLGEISALAGGSVKSALALIDDPLLREWRPYAKRLVELALKPPKGVPVPVHELAAKLGELGTGAARDALFDRMALLLRDVLMLRVGAPSGVLFHEDLRESLVQWALRLNPEAIMQRLRLVEETHALAKTYNIQTRFSFERLLLALVEPAGSEGARPQLKSRVVL